MYSISWYLSVLVFYCIVLSLHSSHLLGLISMYENLQNIFQYCKSQFILIAIKKTMSYINVLPFFLYLLMFFSGRVMRGMLSLIIIWKYFKNCHFKMYNLKLIFFRKYFIYHVHNAVCKSYVPVSVKQLNGRYILLNEPQLIAFLLKFLGFIFFIIII